MAHYLLSMHSVEGEVREPPSEAAMREMQQRLGDVEQDLKTTGTWASAPGWTARRRAGGP